MPFWLLALAWIGFTVVGELLRPKPKFPTPSASGLGDLRVPIAEQGAPIAWALGTVKIAGGNVLWYGDLEVRPIKKKVKTGLFSSTRITIGYQYFWGEHMGLCLGPIDEVVELLFDDKPVGAGAIIVEAGKNVIRFTDGLTDMSAEIPPGSYSDPMALAKASTAAMIEANDGGSWKVCYGFHLIPDHSEEVVYAVEFNDGFTTTATNKYLEIPGPYLTGRDAARALADAINHSEKTTVAGGARIKATVDYDEFRGKYVIGYTSLRFGVVGVYIRGFTTPYDQTALPNLGFQIGTDHYHAGSSGTFTSGYVVRPRNFIFAYGGTLGRLLLEDPLFTARDLFGLPASGEPELLIYCAPSERGSTDFVVYSPLGDTVRLVVNAPNQFGGPDREGGIVGTIDVAVGSLTQKANDYLSAQLGTVAAWRGLCAMIFKHFMWGQSAYPKNPALVIRKTPNGLELEDGHHNIGGDANPLCGLYELATDTFWAAAIDPGLIDLDSFRAAAETCFDEGLGISMLTQRQAAAGELAAEILRHIDGVSYVDPFSGKLAVKLARDDYDLEDLPSLDADTYDDLDITFPQWSETRNAVRIRFTERSNNFAEAEVDEQNLAAFQARGILAVETIDFLGLSNKENAQRAAARALKTISYPLAAVTLTANRKAWRLRPGAVFKLNSARYGIVDLPCRVTDISTGEMEPGTIKVSAAEDIFGLDRTSYTPPPSDEWTDPSQHQQGLGADLLLEAPYTVAGEDRRVMTFGAPGSKPAEGYQVWSDPTGGTAYDLSQTVNVFTPYALLGDPIGPADDSFILTGPGAAQIAAVSDAGFAAGALLFVIDREIIAARDVVDNGDGTVTISRIARGCVDTAPREHAGGADVWVMTGGYGFTQDDPFVADGFVAAKLLPFLGSSLAEIQSIPRESIELASRGLRPYCGTALSVNGAQYPENITGELVLAWKHRDRGASWSYADSGALLAAEAGVTYTLRIYGEDDELIRTETGLSSPAYTYLEADELSDTGAAELVSRLRFTIHAKRDTLESYDALEHTIRRGVAEEGGGGEDAHDVKVSDDDTTPGFLAEKIVAGEGIALAVLNDGDDESLEISATGEAIDAHDVKVSSDDTTPGFLEAKIVAGANVTITTIGGGGDETLEIAADSGAEDAHDVKVSSDDTTPGFLEAKIVAGSGISLAVLDDGDDETLEISADGGGSDAHDVKVSSDDTTPGFLATKIVAGTGISLAVLSDGADERLEITNTGDGGGGGSGYAALWFPMRMFSSGNTSGVQERGSNSQFEVLLFSGMVDKYAELEVVLPEDFSSIDSWQLFWIDAGASSGNVRWKLFTRKGPSSGTSYDQSDQSATVTAAMPNSNQVLSRTTLTNPGTTGLAAGDILHINLQRLASSDAADTATGFAGLIGLRLKYNATTGGGGGGSGAPARHTWKVNGRIETGNGKDGTYVPQAGGTITKLALWRGTAGGGGTTTVALMKNGSSVATLSINASDGDDFVASSTVSIAYSAGDKLRADCTAAETGEPADFTFTEEG